MEIRDFQDTENLRFSRVLENTNYFAQLFVFSAINYSKMDNPILKTSADDLYELVISRKKISVEETAKILKIPNDIVQALVDFLVEEKIFGIEYKFTTPYIYISQEKDIALQTKVPIKLATKDEFFQKTSKWNVPLKEINHLWKRYVKENLNSIKEEFYIKAHSRNLPMERIDNLWKKYLTYLW